MSEIRILVCDDEPCIFHVVAAKLRNAGFDVTTAEDGAEAFELATADPPALVITDFQMPRMSGLELCTQLRSQSQTADVPVIMLTARGYSIEPSELSGTNIRVVLPKPFSPRELLANVQQILGQSSRTVTATNPQALL